MKINQTKTTLGNTITSNLIWDAHVGEISRIEGKRLFLMFQLERSGIHVKYLSDGIREGGPAHVGICLSCTVVLTHAGYAK